MKIKKSISFTLEPEKSPRPKQCSFDAMIGFQAQGDGPQNVGRPILSEDIIESYNPEITISPTKSKNQQVKILKRKANHNKFNSKKLKSHYNKEELIENEAKNISYWIIQDAVGIVKEQGIIVPKNSKKIKNYNQMEGSLKNKKSTSAIYSKIQKLNHKDRKLRKKQAEKEFLASLSLIDRCNYLARNRVTKVWSRFVTWANGDYGNKKTYKSTKISLNKAMRKSNISAPSSMLLGQSHKAVLRKRQKKFNRLMHEWHYKRITGDQSATIFNRPRIEDVDIYGKFTNFLSENCDVEFWLILFFGLVLLVIYPLVYVKSRIFLEDRGMHGSQ